MKKPFLFMLCFASCIIAYANADSTLNEYTGKYRFPGGCVIRHINISVEDSSTLFVKATLGNVYLDRIAADSFSVEDYSGYVVFVRNETKNIVGIHVKVDKPDVELEGTKDPVPVSKNSSTAVAIINVKKNQDSNK
jgi:hypothetical protein